MGKNTRKPAQPRKPKNTPLPRSSPTLALFAKHKLIRKTPAHLQQHPHSDRIRSLLNEDLLTCSICLQLLLSPVLAQCGHPFCLTCAQDLASHGFACGICHSHQPSYDLPASKIIESLLYSYLLSSEEGELDHYHKRRQLLEKKEERRRIGDVQVGDSVDFWCENDLVWKNGTVTNTMKNGILTINSKKGSQDVVLHSSSRKLAPSHHFTKEEEQPNRPSMNDMQIRPMLVQNRGFDPMRMRMEERPPQLIQMPMILGYYVRGNEEGQRAGAGVFDGLEPFNF